jgi:hypothetical protein
MSESKMHPMREAEIWRLILKILDKTGNSIGVSVPIKTIWLNIDQDETPVSAEELNQAINSAIQGGSLDWVGAAVPGGSVKLTESGSNTSRGL